MSQHASSDMRDVPRWSAARAFGETRARAWRYLYALLSRCAPPCDAVADWTDMAEHWHP